MDTVQFPTPCHVAPARRRIWQAAGATVLVAGLACYAWYWFSMPAPPTIDLAGFTDPAVAQAVDSARHGVIRNPRSAAAWGRLGQVLLAHAYVVEAKPCLAQAEQLDPTDARWPYLQGWGDLLNHPEEAVACFQRALARSTAAPERAEAARLRLAQTLFDRGRLDDAAAQFHLLVGSDLAAPLAHLGLGSIALDRDDLSTAIKHLEISAASPWSRHRACARLAALYGRKGNPALAAEWDRRSRQRAKDPEWPDPFLQDGEEMVVGKQMRFIRAENLQREGRLAEAAERCRELVRDYPNDTRIRVKLGMILAEQQDYKGAETVLRDLLRIDPAKIQGHFLLSATLFHQAEQIAKLSAERDQARKRFGEAADQARQTLALQPNHGFAYVYLGLCLRHLGRLDEAIVALQRAVQCSPESVDPHLHLGEALLQAGRRAEGLAQLSDAVRVAPPSDHRPRTAFERAGSDK